jgi:Zn-finger nucleic acid-binding protein
MLKIPYTEGSEIIVDKCPSCQGYYFDVGELEAVQVVFRNMQDQTKQDQARRRAARAAASRKSGRLVRWSAIAVLLLMLAALAVWSVMT